MPDFPPNPGNWLPVYSPKFEVWMCWTRPSREFGHRTLCLPSSGSASSIATVNSSGEWFAYPDPDRLLRDGKFGAATSLESAERQVLTALADFGVIAPLKTNDAPQPKPKGYLDRRAWQDAARARGEIPECGREACKTPADPAWVNSGTPLLYCEGCAKLINGFNPGLCTPEAKG